MIALHDSRTSLQDRIAGDEARLVLVDPTLRMARTARLDSAYGYPPTAR
jgi:hypothetical protein